jgi:predicted Zn-dependent peptidase
VREILNALLHANCSVASSQDGPTHRPSAISEKGREVYLYTTAKMWVLELNLPFVSAQLEHEIEKLGCRLNAYTSREQTVFYANVLKEDVNKVLEKIESVFSRLLII